jgi:hypothetical protein
MRIPVGLLRRFAHAGAFIGPEYAYVDISGDAADNSGNTVVFF